MVVSVVRAFEDPLAMHDAQVCERGSIVSASLGLRNAYAGSLWRVVWSVRSQMIRAAVWFHQWVADIFGGFLTVYGAGRVRRPGGPIWSVRLGELLG